MLTTPAYGWIEENVSWLFHKSGFHLSVEINSLCFGCALLRLVIGLKKKQSSHFRRQSDVKPKPIRDTQNDGATRYILLRYWGKIVLTKSEVVSYARKLPVAFLIFIHFSIFFPTKIQVNVWEIKSAIWRVLAQAHPTNLVNTIFCLVP